MISQRGKGGLQVLGLVLYDAFGILILTIMPSLVGVIHARFGAGAQVLGLVASVALGGGTAGIATVLFASHRFSIRQFILAGTVLMIAASLAIGFVDHLAILTALLFLIGLGGGFSSGASLRAAALFANPDRIYGLLLVGQMGIGFLGFLLLPEAARTIGLGGAFAAFAVICLMCLPLCIFMPHHVSNISSNGRRLDSTAIIFTCSILAYYLGNSCLWAYADRIGAANGIAPAIVDHALAGSMISGFAGATLATFWGRIFSWKSGVANGVIVMAISALLLSSRNPVVFSCAVLLMNFSVMFILPLYLAILAGTSKGEHAATLGTLAAYVGLMVGPAIGGTLVSDDNFNLMITVTIVLFGGALILAMLGGRGIVGQRVKGEI